MTTTPPARRPWIVRTVVTVIVIVLAALALAVTFHPGKRFAFAEEFPAERGGVHVVNSNGRVEVASSPDDSVHVDVSGRTVGKRPKLSHDVSDDALRLEVKCHSRGFGLRRGCDSTIRLLVPAEDRVVVDTNNGDVVLTALTGVVSVHTDNGDVSGISLACVSATVDTNNGDVRLGFASGPDSVAVATDNGDVHLTVPQIGPGYNVQTKADNGDVDVTIVSNSSAQRTITATTSNGDIEIRGS